MELTWSAGGWEETGTGGAGNQGGMREDTLKAGGRRELRRQEQEGGASQKQETGGRGRRRIHGEMAEEAEARRRRALGS